MSGSRLKQCFWQNQDKWPDSRTLQSADSAGVKLFSEVFIREKLRGERYWIKGKYVTGC